MDFTRISMPLVAVGVVITALFLVVLSIVAALNISLNPVLLFMTFIIFFIIMMSLIVFGDVGVGAVVIVIYFILIFALSAVLGNFISGTAIASIIIIILMGTVISRFT
jgi:hypothetical protein